MEQNIFMLLATAICGALATLFAIIGVATPAWDHNGIRLFSLGNMYGYNYTAAGVLLIIAIVFLAIASVFAVLILGRLISNPSDRLKGLILALIVIAVIFIVTAYSRTVHNEYYSYHLSVTAGVLAFLSAIFFTYWIGHTSVSQLP